MSISDIELLLSGTVHTGSLKGDSLIKQFRLRDKLCQKYHGKTLQEWADIHGVSINHMYRQYHMYKRADVLLKTANGGTIKRYRGLMYSEWAIKLDVKWVTIDNHIKKYGNLKLVRKNKKIFLDKKIVEKPPVPIVRAPRGKHIRTPETRKKMSQARFNLSPQARANIQAANEAKRGVPQPHNNKAVRTPLGNFDSITQAANAHNLKWGGTIRDRIKRGYPGYEYV